MLYCTKCGKERYNFKRRTNSDYVCIDCRRILGVYNKPQYKAPKLLPGKPIRCEKCRNEFMSQGDLVCQSCKGD